MAKTNVEKEIEQLRESMSEKIAELRIADGKILTTLRIGGGAVLLAITLIGVPFFVGLSNKTAKQGERIAAIESLLNRELPKSVSTISDAAQKFVSAAKRDDAGIVTTAAIPVTKKNWMNVPEDAPILLRFDLSKHRKGWKPPEEIESLRFQIGAAIENSVAINRILYSKGTLIVEVSSPMLVKSIPLGSVVLLLDYKTYPVSQ